MGHWKEFKDGMSSDAIEGELSYLEANPIFSPSMLTTDISFEPSSTSMIPLMLFLLSLMMILEIY